MLASLTFLFIPIPEDCENDDSNYCWEKLAQTGFASLIKIVTCLNIGCTYIYMSEIFPSVFRGIGVGFVAIIGRAGCIFAPFVSDTLTS